LIGLAWLVVWFFVARRPDIRLVRRRDAVSTRGPRWGDPHLWAFISAYALGALPLGFVLYQAALYLNQALGHSQSLIGKLLWIPPLGWEVGYFVWGWISDRAFRSGLSRDAALRRMMASTLALSLPFALVPYARELWLVMLGLFLAMFAAAGFVILAVAYATNVYSTEHSGLVAGIGAGSWGAAVALAMPFFGHFFDQQRYSTAFLVATVFPVVGFVGWWVVNRRDRVVS
jgi:ACS family hexuronate transporter-like MFS transporter